MLFTTLAFIIALGILIFIHELGHYLLAKKLGIGVEKFSLGFGPKIIGKKVGDTEYLISAIPFGGYVKLEGENPLEECKDIKRSFYAAPVWKRFSVVVAGPIFNMILPVIVFSITLMVGVSVLGTTIGEILEDSPAISSGIKTGDKIVAINDREIYRFDELKEIVSKNPNKSLKFKVEREGEAASLFFEVTPKVKKYTDIFGDEREEGQIGIKPSEKNFVTERYNPIIAVYKGAERTINITDMMIRSIIKMIEGKVSSKEIGGPLLIAKMAGEQAKEGVMTFLNFIAFISINLGIMNLFPIPVLDGGHLFFFTIEAITGKKLSEKKMEFAQQVGLFLLVSLMVFATYNDILRFDIMRFFK